MTERMTNDGLHSPLARFANWRVCLRVLAKYLTTSDSNDSTSYAEMKECTRTRGYAKENREISSADSNLTLMAGERKARKRGLLSWRISFVRASFIRLPAFSSILASLRPLSHSSFQPLFLFFDVGVFCSPGYLSSFVSTTDYITV